MDATSEDNSTNIGATETREVDLESSQRALSNQSIQRSPTPIPTPQKADTSQQEQSSQEGGPSDQSTSSSTSRSSQKPGRGHGRGGRGQGRGGRGLLALTSFSNNPQPKSNKGKGKKKKGNDAKTDQETLTILNKVDVLSTASLNQSKTLNNLSTQIEGLIEVLQKQMHTPSPEPMATTLHPHGVSAIDFKTSSSSEDELKSHSQQLIDFFSTTPFDMSLDFIHLILLPYYQTLNSVFSAHTLKLHVSSLIIKLNRAKRLDDYEHFEQDFITYLSFVN